MSPPDVSALVVLLSQGRAVSPVLTESLPQRFRGNLCVIHCTMLLSLSLAGIMVPIPSVSQDAGRESQASLLVGV